MAFLKSMRQWLKSSPPDLFEWLTDKAEVLDNEGESLEHLPRKRMEDLQQRLDAWSHHPEG